MKTIGETQIATVNTARLEVLQFAHGCIDPTFTVEEAQHVAEHFGPAFKKVVAKVDELSGVDKEAYEQANARFQSGRNGAADVREEGLHEAPAGSDGPDLPARAGAPAGDASGGDV